MFWPTRFAWLHSQGSVGSHAKVREERHANSSKRIRRCFGDRVGHDYWPSLRGGMEHTRIPNCWSNKGLILLEFVGFSYMQKTLLLYRCSLCGGVIMSFMCFYVCLLHSSPVLPVFHIWLNFGPKPYPSFPKFEKAQSWYQLVHLCPTQCHWLVMFQWKIVRFCLCLIFTLLYRDNWTWWAFHPTCSACPSFSSANVTTAGAGQQISLKSPKY